MFYLSAGLDVRLPPNDQPMPTTKQKRGRGRPKRTPQLAASFNMPSTMTTSQTTATESDVNSAIEGLLTINPEILNSMGLQATASTLASQAQVEPYAMQLFDSMQEGAMTEPSNDATMSEEDKAVQQILSQMPGPPGPSVQAVQNPSSVIELNHAGNWQLDGVEITDQKFAEELSRYAAPYLENTTSGDLDKVNLTDLMDASMGGDILISEPNSPEMMVEGGGVNDSVTLPFSNSIELGANPPRLNQDSNK